MRACVRGRERARVRGTASSFRVEVLCEYLRDGLTLARRYKHYVPLKHQTPFPELHIIIEKGLIRCYFLPEIFAII